MSGVVGSVGVTHECKPCPFCGRSFLGMTGSTQPRAAVNVECDECGAQGPPAFVGANNDGRKPKGAKALARWNAEALGAETRAAELWNRR